MAAVAGPTQEATTALTHVPTDLPPSILCEDDERDPLLPDTTPTEAASDNVLV